MALIPCVPCNCTPGNEIKETWQQNVRVTLCSILAALLNPPAPPEPVPSLAILLAAKTGVASGVLTASWTATTFLAAAPHKLSGGSFENATDVKILVSFDGGTTTHFEVPPGETYPFAYGQNNAEVTAVTDLYIKSASGADGTIGEWNVSGYYV